MAASIFTAQPCTATEKPSDYVDDLNRGTVAYKPGYFNYSFHNVVIPDGLSVAECNFTQCDPNTPAISGAKLRFVNCNLTNCAIDPMWVLENCNTTQAWLVTQTVDGELREKRQWICSHPSELKGTEIQPLNAVTARVF